ncbi:MAG: glycosyltransferase [Candidatus Izemoplasmatales bacterium]
MKTLLIALYPYNGQGLDAWHDHGAGMTYTAAKVAGCDIDFLDLKTLNNDSELNERIKSYDLVCFGLKSSYYSIGMKVIKYAKAAGAKTMVAGYHVTAAPSQLLENPDIDYIFHGESEITFPQFLKDPSSFPREIFGEKPQNLDDLPFMDRTIYRDYFEPVTGWWYGPNRHKMISVMAARGCPYECGFCQPIEHNHFGRKLRRRSVDSVISEMKWLKDTYNPDCLMIHDDTFLIQPSWIEEFIEKYPQINLPFWASGRADGICKHPDLVKRLVDVGWELISVGFESGSQRILDKMNKGTTVEQNIKAAKIIRDSGAKIYANYMLGLPWETKEDIQATARMADIIAAEMPSWAFFTPYPGCAMGEECIELGWSLLDRNNYNRCPSGEKVKGVDYAYLNSVLKGHRDHFSDIIIPTYNNEQLTIDCLDSIKKYTKEGTYRIIWVDNNSKDTTKVEETIASMNHLLIRMPKNEGFVNAINAGLKASSISTADTICLLNNDTQVSPNWLEKLTSSLYSSKDIGIVGPLTGPPAKDHQYDSQHNIAYRLLYNKSLSLPPWTDLLSFNIQLERQHKGKLGNVEFIAFLCALIKREVIDKVGNLDTRYDMGMWDDLDYCRSAQSIGYKSKVALDTCIIHKGRATFKTIQKTEGFDVQALIKKNKGKLDAKWRNLLHPSPSDVIVVSRAIYSEMGDADGISILTERRLDIMQRYFINSLNNQTDMNFILYMVVGDPDSEATLRIKSLDWGSLNVAYIHTKPVIWTPTENGWETDIGCPEDLVRKISHPMSSIMARLDTDDWVAPGWIAHMNYMANTVKEPRFLINYQIIGQAPNGLLYTFSAPHTKDRTSPFMALVQKEGNKFSPYRLFHLHMGRLFNTIYTIPPFYAFMSVHNNNRYNHIYDVDKFTFIKESVDSSTKSPTVNRISINVNHKTTWRDKIDRLKNKQSGVQS